MHPEIENLINMALADGEVTDKERAIILRKAESLGLDKDEIEMILDGRISLMNKTQLNPPDQQPQTTKEGEIKKCPACGSPVKSFKIKCDDCGHEFRGSKVLSSKARLYQELAKAETEERSRPLSLIEKFEPERFYQERIDSRKASIISSFPIPNNKEDILEFFNLSIQESLKTGGRYDNGKLRSAWKTKSAVLRSKIALKMSDDSHAQTLIKEYDRSQKKFIISGQAKASIYFFLLGMAIFLLIGSVFYFGNSSYDKSTTLEKARLEIILNDIYNDINSKNYESALLKSSNLRWEYESQWSNSNTHREDWEQKRIEIINLIKELQSKN